MTLLPAAPLGVRGHPGNAYDVPPTCSHPACDRQAAHVHHCWPRSFLRRQPIEWVQYENGPTVGNRLGFCVEHHAMLTGEIGGYRARLRWEEGVMWWENRNRPDSLPAMDAPDIYAVEGWIRIGPTKHQPPVAGRKVMDDLHPELGEDEQCPHCGHVKRKSEREEPKPGKLRPTKEWTISVPDDAEVGADLLDEWVEDFAIVFGMDHYTSRLKRYHVLSVLRGVTLAMRSDIIAEVAAAAGRRLKS